MEIAIPIIALGAMYVIDKEKTKEGFETNEISADATTTNTDDNITGPLVTTNVQQWPTKADKISSINSLSVNQYNTPGSSNAQYYDKDISQKINNTRSSKASVRSLTGNKIDTNNFKHNNMVPFFGGKIRGCGADPNVTESTLDTMQGAGSQYIRKTEQGSLFKPTKNIGFSAGAPNTTDFMRSRVNPSLKMANVLPWEKQQVGPGLNNGYTNNASGGLNAGMESRDSWMPKTVDDLRVATNPKQTFELTGHEGPLSTVIKNASTKQTLGNVEKYRPDTYYSVGPERWFTTAGGNEAPTARSNTIMHEQNRHKKPYHYFGASSGEKDAPTARGNYQDAKRTNLPGKPIGTPSAVGQNAGDSCDYGASTLQTLPNNRSTTENTDIYRNVSGTVRALVAPVLDALRFTRKEDMINNARPNGNVGGLVPKTPVFNPADRTKTTIREMTEGKLAGNHYNVQAQQTGMYAINNQQLKPGQRETTNVHYAGSAAPVGTSADRSYEAAYRQHNNTYKSQENRPNQGGTQIFNQYSNISIRKRDCDRQNINPSGNIQAHSIIPSTDTYGKTNVPAYQPQTNDNRMNADLLDAFKQNPYTQSLQSWA